MPHVRATDQDLERFAGKIVGSGRKLTILALREAAGGGSPARLSRFVDKWNREHGREAAGKRQTGRAPPAMPQAVARPSRRRAPADREPGAAIGVIDAARPGGAAQAAELAGTDARISDPAAEPGAVMASAPPSEIPTRTAAAAEIRPEIPMAPASDAAAVAAAALTARLDALARENDRLWALLREDRASRDQEIETLNRLVAQQNRLLDNASRMLDLATHQAHGELELLRW